MWLVNAAGIITTVICEEENSARESKDMDVSVTVSIQ